MKLAHLRSFFTSMDGKSMFLLLRQFQGIYKEKSVGHFPELLEPTHFYKRMPRPRNPLGFYHRMPIQRAMPISSGLFGQLRRNCVGCMSGLQLRK